MDDNKLALLRNDITEQSIIELLRQNGWFLDHVEKTPEHCLAAVRQDGNVLRIIPKSLQTEELCHEAIKTGNLPLNKISNKIITYDLCLKAVKVNGRLISDIPKEFINKNLCREAVKQNGGSLWSIVTFLGDAYVDEEICRLSVMQKGLVLEHVPKKYYSKELFELAVNQSGLALKYVPENYKSKQLCMTALNNNIRAFLYFPNKLMKDDLCHTAIRADWRNFVALPDKYFTADFIIDFFEHLIKSCEDIDELIKNNTSSINGIAKRIPAQIQSDIRIIRYERLLRARYFKVKAYDKNSGIFRTEEYISYKEFSEDSGLSREEQKTEKQEFASFLEFYKHLDGDTQDANLLDYDFKSENMREYNLDGALIRSDTLIANDLYDDSFYKNAIQLESAPFATTIANEVVEACTLLHESDLDSAEKENTRKIYYISDIHLNHKLIQQFPHHATKAEVISYIKELVRKMIGPLNSEEIEFQAWRKPEDILLIGGDISFNIEVAKIFYQQLSSQWEKSIYVILGNHELWNRGIDFHPVDCEPSVESVVAKYCELFDDTKITLLHNDLLVLSDYGKIILSERHLQDIEPNALLNICLKSNLIILGGLGFSGLCRDFNATHGIYRQTIISLEEDKLHTTRFTNIYNKLRTSIEKECVVVFTHTPKNNWSNTEYNCSWVYVNGHTHRNNYICNDKMTVYSDNQIGYKSKSIGLKHFYLSTTYDVFKYHSDGIYTITREQYLDFNRGMNVNATFNRTNGLIHMLKREGVYCFIFENTNSKTFSLLNGGQIKRLQYPDLNYYYEHMVLYSNAIKQIFSGYNDALKIISNTIKAFGGDGTTHGCIIDIDFLNHIYLNPSDGSICPYIALSIVDKFVYPNIQALLSEQRKDLLDKYLQLMSNNTDGIRYLEGKAEISNVEVTRFVSDTSMYNPSRIMKSLQYLTEANIIRIWSDKIFETGIQKTKRLSATMLSK